METTQSEKQASLTQRQQDVLSVIREHIQTQGVPPTRAEIAKALGFRSVNAAEDHLRALARKGVIHLSAGTSRGIQLVGQYGVGLPVIHSISTSHPLLSEQHIHARMQVDHRLFSKPPKYLYRVHDMSMRDAGIWEKDLIAVHPCGAVESGQIALVRLHHRDLCVKRVFLREKDRIELQSAHPDFAAIQINLTHEPFQIEGVVVGVVRRELPA